MHELPLQENGDNLEEQHFTTALTLMAEVETEQSLKTRVNPSGICQTGRRRSYSVRKHFQNKSCTQGSNHRSIASLERHHGTWKHSVLCRDAAAVLTASLSSGAVAGIRGTHHLHGSKMAKKGQKTPRSSCTERGNKEHSKNIPHKATQGLVSSSTWYGVDIIPKDLEVDEPSVCSIPALQDPALCYWGSNKPRYSLVCWMKNPHVKQPCEFQRMIHTTSYLSVSMDCAPGRLILAAETALKGGYFIPSNRLSHKEKRST